MKILDKNVDKGRLIWDFFWSCVSTLIIALAIIVTILTAVAEIYSKDIQVKVIIGLLDVWDRH